MSNEAHEPFQRDDRLLRTLSGHTDWIHTMAFVPGGQRLVTGSADKTIRIWAVGDYRQEGKSMVHATHVFRLAVTNNGRRVISSEDDGNITVWDLEMQEPVAAWKHTEAYPQIAVSADDRLFAYGSGTIIIREMNGRRFKHEIEIGGTGMALCFSCDGSKLAMASTHIFIHDVESGRRILALEGHELWVYSLQWSRDGSRLYSASSDRTIRCWNTTTGQQIGQPWKGHFDSIFSLSLSRDGTKLASGSWDKTVRFWDSSGHPTGLPLQHDDRVFAVCISPSNDVVAVAREYGQISFWRVPWRSDENQSSEPTPRVPSVSSKITIPTRRPQIIGNSPKHVATVTNRLQSSRTIRDDPQDRPREPTTNGGIESPATLNVLSSQPVQIVQPRAEPTSISHTSSRQDESERSTSAPLDLTPYIAKLDDRYLEGGSFGDVYRCSYIRPTGTVEVAIKSFRFHFTLEEGSDTTHAVKMVRRELGIWRRLDHPNIVPFLGTATGFGMQGSLALVSTWMPNGSLHRFLENHGEKLHVVHQLQFLWDIANGLDYLHTFPGSPIVHGDLNGHNVLVDDTFNARLVDFGYSTVVGNIPDALAYLQRSTARPGAIRWSAPELILAEEDEATERTPKSDIYSFGCLTLQVLSGKQPWSEVREEGAIAVRMVKGQKPKRPESRTMDDRHWEFIQRCWSSDEERPTAWTLAAVLQEYLSACPQSPSLRDMFTSLQSS